jgi:hypothetical protein
MPPTNVELAQQVDQLSSRLDQLTSSTPGTAATGVGSLVSFETTDPILETPIGGVGVVVDVDDQGALVAPLAVQGLRLKSDELWAHGTDRPAPVETS